MNRNAMDILFLSIRYGPRTALSIGLRLFSPSVRRADLLLALRYEERFMT